MVSAWMYIKLLEQVRRVRDTFVFYQEITARRRLFFGLGIKGSHDSEHKQQLFHVFSHSILASKTPFERQRQLL